MNAASPYHNIHDWLRACQRPLVVSHRRPDGDALGALAGLTLALADLGIDARPALYEPLPARYARLGPAVTWRRWDLEREALIRECDALVIVDTCAFSQLEPIADWLAAAPRTLVIDHHPTGDALGERPGDLKLVDASAAAVCLLIAEWVEAAGLRMTPAIAQPLFTGLATDTGWFRFSNTDARTLRVAARMLEVGVPASEIYDALFQRDPPEKLRLIARMLGSLELRANGRLAVQFLRQADFAAAGADRSQTEDLVNEAGRLAGTEATILFTEEPDGSVRVNFRSKRWLDVADLARQFGGGGHARAAGARPKGSWDIVVSRVITAAEERLRENREADSE